jgi:hypothetical protein
MFTQEGPLLLCVFVGNLVLDHREPVNFPQRRKAAKLILSGLTQPDL